jgi:hypothetical protein
MKFWKLGFALSITVALSLTACDDSSSSSNDNGNGEYKPGTIGCTVLSKSGPYIQETRMDDLTITFTVERNSDGSYNEIFGFNKAVPADTCDKYKRKIGTEYEEVTCKDSTITAKSEKVQDNGFNDLISAYAALCKEANGKEIPDIQKDDIDLSKLGKCDAKTKGDEFVVEGTGVSLVCDGEFWVPAKVDCAKEGEEKDFDTIELVCKDKKWTFETEEDCTKAMKKSETLLDLVKVSATCVDKAWQIDLYEAEQPSEEEPATEDKATTEEE